MRRMITWVCPKMCGCEININADWSNDPVDYNGASSSFQHPIPYTITEMSIKNVCAEHASLTTAELPADPYNGCPGYIKLPIDNPTEAQKLYIQLYRYNGQRLKPDTCGCKIYQVWDDIAQVISVTPHPNTVKCPRHQADDALHTQAFTDSRMKQRVSQLLLQDNELADVKADGTREFKPTIKPVYTFDNNNVLSVVIPGVSRAKQDAINLLVISART